MFFCKILGTKVSFLATPIWHIYVFTMPYVVIRQKKNEDLSFSIFSWTLNYILLPYNKLI